MSVRIEASDLVHRYARGGTPSLDGASLVAARGEMLTIVGPSGSGKSTLLAIIAGLEEPESGVVSFDGRDITDVPAEDRAVGLVLQGASLFPHLSVAGNVAFGLAAKGVKADDRARAAARWLSLVGLGGMESRRARQLSGGQAQRVALVRALAVEPDVLLLDEPLASLDDQVRRELQDVLRDLVARTGVTGIMVTHDLAEAMSLGTSTAILVDGSVIAQGAPEQVFRRPATRRAAAFVGVSTFFTGRLRAGCLETAAGPVRIAAAGGDADPVTVAIRPEDVRLADAGDTRAGDNLIPGTVGVSVFRGTHWDCTVDTALGPVLARTHVRPPRPGETARIRMNAHDLFPVEEDPGGQPSRRAVAPGGSPMH
jgi:ABC-type Fe3+/spermidine/putrescine transport system ATPase subunit